MIAQVWTCPWTAELTAGDSWMKLYSPDQEQQIWIYPVSRQHMITPKLRFISQHILEIPGVVLLCLLIPAGWTGRNGGFKAMLSRALDEVAIDPTLQAYDVLNTSELFPGLSDLGCNHGL